MASPGLRTRLGVIGWPVAHSRSPQMQNAALRASGMGDWRYQLLPVPPDLFEVTVPALAAAGFRGVNVTIPYKERALGLADSASPAATAIGAANTLLFGADERIEADNTDGPGLIEALPAPPAGKTALVLGAGGSARAAVWALIGARASEVRVWNRSLGRAQTLAAELGAKAVRNVEPADLLVNCTPAGMEGTDGFKQLPLNADEISMFKCVVDFAYAPVDTPLVAAAKTLGVPVLDGVELLVAQGALSFERFTGSPAPLGVMTRAAHDR